MRKPDLFRYLLACRPDAGARAQLAAASARAGQRFRPDLYHLTWFVIAERPVRNAALKGRVEDALAGLPLHAAAIRLGLVTGGDFGAVARTVGPQPALQDAYRTLGRALARCGLPPRHRKSGFRPHVTLGHGRCRFPRFRIALEWVPDRLLLIESEVGLTKHNVLAHWPLLPPRQGLLPLAAPSETIPLVRRAS